MGAIFLCFFNFVLLPPSQTDHKSESPLTWLTLLALPLHSPEVLPHPTYPSPTELLPETLALICPAGSLRAPESHPSGSHFSGQPTPTSMPATIEDSPQSCLAWGQPCPLVCQSNHGPTTTGGCTKSTPLDYLALGNKKNCATGPYRTPCTWTTH